MENLLQQIETRSEQLSASSFCKWIKFESTQLNDTDTLSFTPSMLYFILGFRDILAHLQYSHPKNALEQTINTHCEEDKNHWMWYLQDLKSLGYNESTWSNNWVNFVEYLWSDENKATRDLVYLCIHEIKKYNHSPEASLVIIECLESTFGVFMNTLKFKFENNQTFKKLKFFGELHQNTELNHSLGSWIDEESDHKTTEHNHSNEAILKDLSISNSMQIELTETINVIYDQFELVFDTWLKNRTLVLEKNISSNQAELSL